MSTIRMVMRHVCVWITEMCGWLSEVDGEIVTAYLDPTVAINKRFLEQVNVEAARRKARAERAEDQLREAKARLLLAQKQQAEVLDRMNRAREETQARVKEAGDSMAAALKAQRDASDRAIESRKQLLAEIEEAERALEAAEMEAKRLYAEIRTKRKVREPTEHIPDEM